MQGTYPIPCNCLYGGGWQPLLSESGNLNHETDDIQRFTGIMSWANPEARIEWYSDLLRARTEYELFGHKLDALKTLS